MKFETQVTRIQWVGKYILGFSEDTHMQLLNTENESVINLK